MAYTKIKQIKTHTHLQQSLDYIINPDKTEEMLYVDGYMCDYKYAADDFNDIYLNAIHKGNNLAHHIIQSYAPDDNITPEKALEIAQEFMRRKYPNYQYVVAVHNDREHLHAHIIMNAVDFETYHKLHTNINNILEMREISDELCRENGLSVIPKDTIKRKCLLMDTVDKHIAVARSFDEFLGLMQESGYEVKIGKYISFRGRGEERFRRGDTIGEAYSEMGIRKRIKGVDINHVPKRIYDDKKVKISNKNRVKYAINDALKVCTNFDEFIAHLRANGMEVKQGVHLSMRIPVAKKFTRTEKLGYEYTEEMLRLYFNNRAEYERIKANHNKTKIQKIALNAEHSKSAAVYNINTQIRMFNLMGEYGIKSPEELDEKIAELKKQEKQYIDSIKSVETMVESNKDKIKALSEYNRTKPYYDKYIGIRSKADKELYGVQYELELKSYKKAYERITDLKRPNGSLYEEGTLRAYIKAEEERIKLFSDKHKSVVTELRNLHLLKENIERINNGGDYEIDRLADNAEFDRYAATHNINTQIQMMNLMGEYGIKTYDELTEEISKLATKIKSCDSNISEYSQCAETNRKALETLRDYQRLKPFYMKYIKIVSPPEKELYGVEYHLELEAYKKVRARIESLKLPDDSFPTEENIIRNISDTEEKISEYTEKRKELEKELHNLSRLKENIDSLNGDDLEEYEEEIEETGSRERYLR
ncbi:MAG: relaxase/mobilization nuclease domain-containing protein [Firmicutes bacterium]|nr:relaxase/mobilization nuclease domain-containing protein [Bacillota bacterium]